MSCINSLINLEVLMHCHYSPTVHPRIEAPAVKEALRYLSIAGLIEQDDRAYTTTDKGKFYLSHILSIPFPIQEFRIPEVEQ